MPDTSDQSNHSDTLEQSDHLNTSNQTNHFDPDHSCNYHSFDEDDSWIDDEKLDHLALYDDKKLDYLALYPYLDKSFHKFIFSCCLSIQLPQCVIYNVNKEKDSYFFINKCQFDLKIDQRTLALIQKIENKVKLNYETILNKAYRKVYNSRFYTIVPIYLSISN